MKKLEKSSNKPGYILVMTLMIVAAATFIVTQMAFMGAAYSHYTSYMLDREQARLIALSGIAIAQAQLSLQDTKFIPVDENTENSISSEALGKNSGKSEKEDPEKNKKDLLKILCAVHDQWQLFELTKKADGYDAQMGIYITCEFGKININQIYDSKAQEFITSAPGKTAEAILKEIGTHIKPFVSQQDFMQQLINFLKKQNRPLITITELLRDKKLRDFKDALWFLPPIPAAPITHNAKEEQNQIYIQDLFTIYGDTYKFYPLFLSRSLKRVLGLKTDEFSQKSIDKIIKNMSLTQASWEKDWDTYLKSTYGQEFKSLPADSIPYLSTKFEPNLFSVVCYGRVGQVEQKLLAILERFTVEKGEAVKVTSMYWI